MIGATAMAAKEWWESRGKEEREDVLEDVRRQEEERKGECDRLNEEHMRLCDDTKEVKGMKAAAICRSSANEIYAACLAGKPKRDWPQLQDR